MVDLARTRSAVCSQPAAYTRRMSATVTLAIETSQRLGSVALRDCGGVLHVEALAETARHDDDLLPAIDRLVRGAGLRPADLRGGVVGVSIGPGGFTGLRIAISTARMFAETLGVRIVSVPSALVAAESFSGRVSILCALASKNETAWCARLEGSETGGGWQIVGRPGVRDAGALELSGIEAMLADDHLPESFRAACAVAGVAIVEPSFTAAACLAVTERLMRGGAAAFTDPLTLLPLYPRPPEAVTLWESRGRHDGR